ncbi:hypothetical protein LTR62_002989 [Meristemomyces frigidus]|uniref:Acetyl-CoA synthetase-like protein n=1 Tax=Meristemomyces frigidus TaxID=1508187 RepID=A0AAN7YJW4_9PEZI|nr:hypothetical protein LTR62_002989 [Meristemomyces frigidus]
MISNTSSLDCMMKQAEAQTSSDRTDLFSRHEGSHVLPNSPLFTKLIRHAHKGRNAIRDPALGVTKTYADVLSDALSLRTKIEQTLDQGTLARLKNGREVFMGVLAPGGYEFTVAILAALALGAAVVPMSVHNPVNEAAFFVTASQQVLLLTSSTAAPLAHNVAAFIAKQQQDHSNLPVIEVLPNLPRTPTLIASQILISSDRHLNDNAAGIVIFTSGTTGRPKGAVLRRAYTHETALAIAEGYNIQPTDILLHVLPVHHATGLGTSFFPFLVSGASIEFRTGSFETAMIWQPFADREITFFSGVPTLYMRLMWHWQKQIASLPIREKARYEAGANHLRIIACGSSALQQPTQLRQGQPILVRYGSSEVPACIRYSAGIDYSLIPKSSVGSAVPGVETKLSPGGELLIKSPFMFSKYLHDPVATATAHDEEGFFRSGDICHNEGDWIFVMGRASLDIIKSGGYKIGAVEIEQCLLGLPYVWEAMVVGVDDEEFRQRVDCAVTLDSDLVTAASGLDVETLRASLRGKLPGYKLPPVLRVVPGELPKGATGKVQKKILGPKFFPVGRWRTEPEVQVWGAKKKGMPEVRARL